ncbi:hypothetical protein Tco_0476110 [Tanacetum coccineum]
MMQPPDQPTSYDTKFPPYKDIQSSSIPSNKSFPDLTWHFKIQIPTNTHSCVSCFISLSVTLLLNKLKKVTCIPSVCKNEFYYLKQGDNVICKEKRHELVEAVSDVDDQLAAAFLDDQPISYVDLDYGGKEAFLITPGLTLLKTVDDEGDPPVQKETQLLDHLDLHALYTMDPFIGSDSDPARQEIDNSMMALLLPRAFSLLKTFTRNKKHKKMNLPEERKD